ncbi:hypothetical protein EWM64_g9816 [Hericium alpestre]|uniref:Uncharacterized protein n=1 Tax=Hericium alpestre TaxID=135208 RepID=A0A4Y9ZHH5_9AGAM|nr:hypothetical protein EWM64_g9816 [Hericium alpestre]
MIELGPGDGCYTEGLGRDEHNLNLTKSTSPPKLSVEANTMYHEVPEDDIPEADHARLDKLVMADCRDVITTRSLFGELKKSTLILQSIIRHSPDILDSRYNDVLKVLDLFEGYPSLMNDLCSAFEKEDFRPIRKLNILRTKVQNCDSGLPRDSDHQVLEEPMRATVQSWKINYQGSTTAVLMNTIRDYLRAQNHYARYFAFVQSSGTGKSRIVDELAKTLISTPVNLAAKTFPPGDRQVRVWLGLDSYEQSDRDASSLRLHAYLYAVLTTTLVNLKEIARSENISTLTDDALDDIVKRRSHELATSFHDHMAKDMTFESHGPFRDGFYKSVLGLANKFVSKAKRNHAGSSNFVLEDTERGSSSCSVDVRSAAKDLLEFIDPHYEDQSYKNPLLLLSFDESHDFTSVSGNQHWSLFSEFQRVLWRIRDFPIFSVFLSTGGTFHLFSPHTDDSSSNRLQTVKLNIFPPVTETGFDELALKVRGDGSWSLEQVVTDEFIAHLGRPLFASRYDAGDTSVRNSIVGFAAQKLMGTSRGFGVLSPAQELACLAVRLPLEFRATSWSTRSMEREQVERHMRICLAATAGFEEMVTVAASEPLLAEAAFITMRNKKMPAATALQNHLVSSNLSVGERGELIATLILLLARDAAVSHVQDSRIVSVLGFLAALFHPDDYETICEAHPARSTHGEANKSLKDSFANAKMWFNHFIKVNDFEVVNQEYLWRLIVRGAAVVCANNMRGFDIILPILYWDSKLCAWNVTAILIQVKNDKSYTANVTHSLFTAMNPRRTGVFAQGAKVLHIIRIVFALAAKDPGVTAVQKSQRVAKPDTYTAYDIWCAGCTHTTFPVIHRNEDGVYQSLLEHSQAIFDVYEVKDRHAEVSTNNIERPQIRRNMCPASEKNSSHWEKFIEGSLDTPVDVVDEAEVEDVTDSDVEMSG